MATRTVVEGVTLTRRKPFGETYIGEWIMTTDHKKIGVMYIVTAFFFFLLGGTEALLIRTQLAVPDGKVLTPEIYDQIFTMHGVTMIFLFVMPMLTGLGNYLARLWAPLQYFTSDDTTATKVRQIWPYKPGCLWVGVAVQVHPYDPVAGKTSARTGKEFHTRHRSRIGWRLRRLLLA